MDGVPDNLVSAVSGAVQLRRWAVAALAGRTASEPGQLSQKSWDLFLEAERCAVPLMLRIAERRLGDTLSPEFRIRLEERAAVESHRIESARRQLAVAADVAAELGCRVVALKGGVAAIDPAHAVDLIDVDVLVEPRHARDFVAALDRRGYRPGGSSLVHLAARWSDEPLPIEVHTTLDPSGRSLPDDFWNRVRPSEQFDGVHLLYPPDHLWHILRHLVVSHPYRQGHLRELLLIGSAVAMSGQNLDEIHGRMQQDRDGAAMEAVMHAAEELQSGSAHSDTLIRVPALGYAVRWCLSRSFGLPSVIGQAHVWSLGLLMGPDLRRLLWSRIWWVTQDPSYLPWLRGLERRFPTAGRFVRGAGRLIRFALAVTLALPVAAVAAAATKRALR